MRSTYRLACRLLRIGAYNDVIFSDLRRGLSTKQRAAVLSHWKPRYDVVIIDEMQDLNDNLFWITRLFISILAQTGRKPPRLIVLGDSRQAIDQYKAADAQYLDLAKDILSDITPSLWVSLKLDKSFRLSHEVAAFVNGFIGEKYIEGSHSSPKPVYLLANLKKFKTLLEYLLPLIRKYGAENTVILGPAVRYDPIIPLLTNELTRLQIPVAQPASDNAGLDDDALRGKLVVSSYDQFKGHERKLAIVYGVDSSYFDAPYRQSLPDDRCPNAMFVALTCALEQLVVVQDSQNAAVPFMSWEKMKQTTQFVNLSDQEPKPQRSPGRVIRSQLSLPKMQAVKNIIGQIDEGELQDLVRTHLDIEKLALPLCDSMCIKAPSKVLVGNTPNHYELVSDLNGLAIMAAFEWERARTCTTLGYRAPKGPIIPEDPKKRAHWFARNAMEYETKVKYTLYQSRRQNMQDHPFDWLEGHLDVAVKRIGEQIPESSRLEFERPMSFKFRVKKRGTLEVHRKVIQIRGKADILDHRSPVGTPPILWEIKFVSSLRLEHVAQVAIYGYLWYKECPHKERPTLPSLILYNVQNGEKWEVKTTQKKLKGFIEGVLKAKYTSKGEKDRSTFLEECRKTSEEVASVMVKWQKKPSALTRGNGLKRMTKISNKTTIPRKRRVKLRLSKKEKSDKRKQTERSEASKAATSSKKVKPKASRKGLMPQS